MIEMDAVLRKKLITELRLAFEGADHFTATLLRIALKADHGNLEKLSKGFPDEVAIVREWRLGMIAQEEVYPDKGNEDDE